jgi:hypothetical protein
MTARNRGGTGSASEPKAQYHPRGADCPVHGVGVVALGEDCEKSGRQKGETHHDLHRGLALCFDGSDVAPIGVHHCSPNLSAKLPRSTK